MSEIYNSSSGSYNSYLMQRQTDEITNQIKASDRHQLIATAVSTVHLSNRIDAVNDSIQRMHTGLQTSINQNTYAIVASTAMLKNTFEEGFDSINNTLDLGFAGVSSQIGQMTASMTAGFSNLSNDIAYWGEKICEKLDAIHDIVENPLLTASRELYRRAEKNAKKKFFEEALEDIKGAVEKNKTDYISWGLMGKIYLFGMSDFSNVVDVSKAIEAFTNACKYVTPDIDETEEAKKIASEFYFYLGFANYVLANEKKLEGKTNEFKTYLEASIKANSKSYVLSDEMLEALYNKARAHSLLGQTSDALECIETIINADVLYSIKVVADSDFKGMESDIKNLITKHRDDLYIELNSLVNDILEKYYFYDTEYAKDKKNKLEKAKNLDSNSPYLDLYFTYIEIKLFYDDLINDRTPFDLVADSIIFGTKEEGACYIFYSKIYNGYLIPSSAFRITCDYYYLQPYTEDVPGSLDSLYHKFGFKEILNQKGASLAGYAYKSYEYGKGKIVLENSNLEGVIGDDYNIFIFYIEEKEPIYHEDSVYVGGKQTFVIDDYSIFEYELLEKKKPEYKENGELSYYSPSKARLSVKLRSIVEYSVINEFEKKAEIKKQEEAQKKEEERIAAEQSASERAYEAEVAKKNKIIYIFGIILFKKETKLVL